MLVKLRMAQNGNTDGNVWQIQYVQDNMCQDMNLKGADVSLTSGDLFQGPATQAPVVY